MLVGPARLVGQEPARTSIAVVNRTALSADKIDGERVPLGEADDYKPCLAQLPSGELLLTAFHQYPKEGGKVLEQNLLFRSTDGGKNWSAPVKLDLLGREPYLSVLKDGTLFLTGHLLANDIRNPYGYTHGYLHRSTDAGKTWQSLRIASEGIKPKASNHSTRNVLQIADGTLLLGVDYDGGDGPYLLWRSKDKGKTWDKTGTGQPKDFKSKYGFFGGETWLWQAKSGKIWALVRVDSDELPIKGRPIKAGNDQADHFILFSSSDEGKTFDRIRDFGDYGEMYMSLLRLADKRLLLTFTVRDLQPPLGVRALPGRETRDGFEFDLAKDRIMLDTRTPIGKSQGGGFGPTVQLNDGTLVTSYSYRGKDDKTHLEVARWKLPAAHTDGKPAGFAVDPLMPRRTCCLTLLLVAVTALPAAADDDVARLLKQVRAVGPEGAGSPQARAAWDRLVARGPAVLPQLLEAMDTPDTVAANWLRTAFDRIADEAAGKGGPGIDADALLRFARNPKRQGRARRLALDVVERLRPGTRASLLRGWTEDTEFRHDAIEQALADLDRDRELPPDKRVATLRRLFAATRDLPQARAVAARLKGLGAPVSVADHFGFLRDWYVIGPFDARGMKGFQAAYPPEQKVDLAASYEGKSKTIGWKRYHSPEARDGTHVALVNMREPLGDAADAVAYAYTAFKADEAREVEFRGAADDNLTVWVNDERAFGFEEYRNGVRLDRHRFRVHLKKGVNTVLVKVCQAPADPAHPEPNWEFLLRVCDADGKGLLFKSALSEK